MCEAVIGETRSGEFGYADAPGLQIKDYYAVSSQERAHLFVKQGGMVIGFLARFSNGMQYRVIPHHHHY